MDSLTQLTLGAAVGELTLGRKIGNRAMMWGAVAGTIPDFDVMAGLFMSDINALIAHRSMTHSLIFAIIFPLLLAAYTHWLYRNNYHKNKIFKYAGFALGILFIGFVIFILSMILDTLSNHKSMLIGLGLVTPIGVYLIYRMWKNYVQSESIDVDVSWKSWYWMFFLATVTHPILDCHTLFGTQFFWPFSNIRIAFNNISVADPLYTIPFLICLIVASFYKRGQMRYNWNLAGVIISSLYMMMTYYNHYVVKSILKDTLAKEGIEYTRLMVNPTILNNILWSATAESENVYWHGLYSFNDDEKKFKLISIPKNHELEVGKEDDPTLKKLKWFSNNYYTILPIEDSSYQFNDMRYGTFMGRNDSPKDYIFNFKITENENGSIIMSNDEESGPPKEEAKHLISDLWERIWGKNE